MLSNGRAATSAFAIAGVMPGIIGKFGFRRGVGVDDTERLADLCGDVRCRDDCRQTPD